MPEAVSKIRKLSDGCSPLGACRLKAAVVYHQLADHEEGGRAASDDPGVLERIAIEHDEIGGFTDLDGAEPVFEPERACAVDRGYAERVGGRLITPSRMLLLGA